jgi:hypothetical protein
MTSSAKPRTRPTSPASPSMPSFPPTGRFLPAMISRAAPTARTCASCIGSSSGEPRARHCSMHSSSGSRSWALRLNLAARGARSRRRYVGKMRETIYLHMPARMRTKRRIRWRRWRKMCAIYDAQDLEEPRSVRLLTSRNIPDPEFARCQGRPSPDWRTIQRGYQLLNYDPHSRRTLIKTSRAMVRPNGWDLRLRRMQHCVRIFNHIKPH